MARDENMIAALKRERAAYVANGNDDRVAQVDKQLAHYGYEPEGEQDDSPQGRTGPDSQQQTADAAGPQPGAPAAAAQPPAKKAAAKKAAAPAAPKTGD